VTRGGTGSIAVLAATALVALLLAACGSSDSDSNGGSSSGETSAQSNGSGGGTHGENDAGTEQQEPGGEGGAEAESTGFTAEEVETPLKVSGGGSEQFLTKGGDNSIQEFGEESDESELQAAAEAVHSFFVARATGDWKGACDDLSKAMTEQLEQLAASSTELEDRGCASFLASFTGKLPASEWRKITTVDAGSLRTEDEQAFLIYYGPEKAVYAMPLKEEGGEWKIGALSGNALG
jgi:hypothetical protein